jgi:hypothetical protein
MRKQVTSILVGLLFLFCAASTSAQKVNTEWDNKAHFSNYKTYAWLESKHPAHSDLLNKRVIENVDKQMAAKGFTKVADNSDVFVVYNAHVKEQVSVGAGYDPASPSSVPLWGILVINFVDGQTRALVWRGTGMDVLSDEPEKNVQSIEKATAKMFKKYPPKHKK